VAEFVHPLIRVGEIVVPRSNLSNWAVSVIKTSAQRRVEQNQRTPSERYKKMIEKKNTFYAQLITENTDLCPLKWRTIQDLANHIERPIWREKADAELRQLEIEHARNVLVYEDEPNSCVLKDFKQKHMDFVPFFDETPENTN
jgi:hypothetical protein